jgi:hypothetical protein
LYSPPSAPFPALGRLGWSLRRIERETGVRRETASAYLQTAGVDVRDWLYVEGHLERR